MLAIKIGKYLLYHYRDGNYPDTCNSIWIDDSESGEGGEFSEQKLIEAIEAFYKENF